MVCSREVAFTVLSWQPAAAAAGFTSIRVCLGKLPPLGNTSAACASLPPLSSPPSASTATTITTASTSTPPTAVSDHLLALRGSARLALPLLALLAETLLLLPAMRHGGGG